jgi:hypothetical protein
MKIKFLAGVIAVLVLLCIIAHSVTDAQSQPKRYVVKLYSGTSAVATWDALDFGRLDGETLIFTVGDRNFPRKVRISGTYIVEEFNQ